MRQYTEVVDRIANQMFGQYMSGSNDVRGGDTQLLGWIYGVPPEQIQAQIDAQYKRVLNAHYAKYKKEKT